MQQLAIQYGKYINAADAARELFRIRQGERETLSELANRVLNLAKIAFKDAVQRDGEAVQTQLAEYFTDANRNTFVRTDSTRVAPQHLQRHLRWHKGVIDWNLPKDTCMGWDGPLGKEKDYVSMKWNSEAVVDLVVAVVKGATQLRRINRNLT